jgi:hypothetical protein
MDIEKAAWDYLNSEPEKPRKKMRRTRNALMNAYEALRKKYVKEKEIVDSIIDEANRLKKTYDKHAVIMNENLDKMKVLRQKINDLDDSGKEFTAMHDEPETEETLPTEEELDNLQF